MSKAKPDNMDRWNRLSKTDPKATKKFKRTGFSGTAINPLYLVRRMTEEFGSAGEGWGVSNVQFQVERVDNVEPMVFCTATIWVEDPSKTVIGVGGDTLITTFKSGGQVADDESFKKAYTDALGNAFKQLGMAADIYEGKFDDNKYVQEREQEIAASSNDVLDAQKVIDLIDAATSLEDLEAVIAKHGEKLKNCSHDATRKKGYARYTAKKDELS